MDIPYAMVRMGLTREGGVMKCEKCGKKISPHQNMVVCGDKVFCSWDCLEQFYDIKELIRDKEK